LTGAEHRLLGAGDVREIAARLDLRPSKRLGQNFVIDQGTLRRIVTLAAVQPSEHVLEVGPGLGSLTLALLPAAHRVLAIEIDPVLAAELPRTVAAMAPGLASRLEVVTADAARIGALPGEPVSVLVANLPYNAAVPVLLHLLGTVPSLTRGVVMVQAEVAERMTAPPGNRTYGVPTVKLAWFARMRRAGSVPSSVFWPVPRVESGLVAFTRHDPPVPGLPAAAVFAVVDAAFAQRRKMLRSALAGWAGSPAAAQDILRRAGVDPAARAESLTVGQFAAVAQARPRGGTR
jgi:16S rRNA (adenine1518-N6/adenine1519-N6)-dimethyltransferase